MPSPEIFSPVRKALALLVWFSPLLPAATLDDLSYIDFGGSISITKCSQTATGALEIPPLIDGKPVTVISDYAFSMCHRLTRVILPPGVSRIGNRSFYQCYGLTGMVIPSGVESIGSEAFFSCDGMTLLTLGSGLTVIGDSTFKWCTKLTAVTFPAGLKTLGSYAFLTCSALKKATFLGNAPYLGDGAFNETPAGFKIQFLDGKKGFTTPIWRDYPAVRLSAEIAVEQPAGNGLTSGAAAKSFGTVVRGKTGFPKKFTVKNAGIIPLTGLTLAIGGTHPKDFIVTAPLMTTLAPGASATFKVTFKPRAKGSRSAILSIKSNDRDQNPFRIRLSGAGK